MPSKCTRTKRSYCGVLMDSTHGDIARLQAAYPDRAVPKVTKEGHKPARKGPRVSVLALLLAAASATAQVTTSPQAEVDRGWSQAVRLVQQGLSSEALEALDNIVELKALHSDLELPPLFWFVHAAAAKEEGLEDVAISSARRYVNEQGNSAEHYLVAIRLITEADLDAVRKEFGDRKIYTPSVDGEVVKGMERPVRKNRPPAPRYPPEARAAGVRGTVVFGMVIDEHGRVAHTSVLQDPGFGFAREALKHVNRQKYRPATLHGEPVPVYWVMTINFPSP